MLIFNAFIFQVQKVSPASNRLQAVIQAVCSPEHEVLPGYMITRDYSLR
jgi:hypothetical protein